MSNSQMREKETELVSSLDCNITKYISPQEQKSIVTSLKKLSSSLMTCQKLYSSVVHQSEKKVKIMFEKIVHLKMIEQETSVKNLL